MSRLKEEMKVIPRGAWVVATVASVTIFAIVCCVMVLSSLDDHRVDPGIILVIGVVGLGMVFLFTYVLLLGYIYGDARRRAMRPVLWLLLAIFAPSAIGIILYFILRQPIPHGCPKCGAITPIGSAFCPACGEQLMQSCPACRSAVEPGWSHCPRCGASLAVKAEAGGAPA